MESSTARRRRRTVCTVAAGLGLAVVLTGCGFGAQTLQRYTPAQGVNVDSDAVKVRNLLVVADAEGAGVLSASIVSSADDRLTGVTGTALKADGTDDEAGQLSVGAVSIQLPANQLVVLTSGEQQIAVQSAALAPGGAVNLELRFASGTIAAATAPVMSSEASIYASVTPVPVSPAPTASETAPVEPSAPVGTPEATPAATP